MPTGRAAPLPILIPPATKEKLLSGVRNDQVWRYHWPQDNLVQKNFEFTIVESAIACLRATGSCKKSGASKSSPEAAEVCNFLQVIHFQRRRMNWRIQINT